MMHWCFKLSPLYSMLTGTVDRLRNISDKRSSRFRGDSDARYTISPKNADTGCDQGNSRLCAGHSGTPRCIVPTLSRVNVVHDPLLRLISATVRLDRSCDAVVGGVSCRLRQTRAS